MEELTFKLMDSRRSEESGGIKKKEASFLNKENFQKIKEVLDNILDDPNFEISFEEDPRVEKIKSLKDNELISLANSLKSADAGDNYRFFQAICAEVEHRYFNKENEN